MKFKAGDRVVVLKHVPYFVSGRVTDLYKQIGTVTTPQPSFVWLNFRGLGMISLDVESVEHEAVYNSPLYKALA